MSDSNQILSEALTGHRTSQAPSPRAQVSPPPRLLVDAAEAAKVLGVGLRTFHNMRDKLPLPVSFGGRCVRWRVADLIGWIADLPGAEVSPEPLQLSAARALKKTKTSSTCGDSTAGFEAPITKNKHQRGPLQTQVPSNSDSCIEGCR